MSTFLIRRSNITILLKLLTNHTVNHQSGVDNVPHLCIKVAHGDGYGWYGLQILDWDREHTFTEDEIESIGTEITEGVHRMTDVKEMLTRLDRLMDSVRDILLCRKRPAIYGVDNQFIHMYLSNNIQFDAFRNTLPASTVSYGGFEVKLQVGEQEHIGFLYHRGVPLANYIDSDMAEAQIEVALYNNFPEYYNSSNPINVLTVRAVDRDRSKGSSASKGR